MAAALAGHPGLAGWYTADKRKADEAERVFHQYTILRSAAPGGITFILQNRPQELLRWRDAVDVIGVDPYPIFGNYPNDFPEPPLAPLEMVTDYSKALVTAMITWASPVRLKIPLKHRDEGHGVTGVFPAISDLMGKNKNWERLLRSVNKVSARI